MYLYDLKVNRNYRRHNIGEMLIEKSKEIAVKHGYNGLYTQGQDNNLAACLFYIKCGFVIGGLNTNVYKGTKQEGEADIYFYLDRGQKDQTTWQNRSRICKQKIDT